MNNQIAHSCEHAFIGSLQILLRKVLQVKKVEHRTHDNMVIIKDKDNEIDIDIIIKAEKQVNDLIKVGRKIHAYQFHSLSDAESKFPALRINRERICKFSDIRVIEIEGHDTSACAKDHVMNLAECEMFIVTNFTKIKDFIEIIFVAGEQAKTTCFNISKKLLTLCSITSSNMNTLEDTIKNIIKENKDLEYRNKILTKDYLSKIVPIFKESINIYVAKLGWLNNNEIRKFITDKLSSPNNIFIITNTTSSEFSNLLFARSEKISISFDCDKIFKNSIAFGNGKGGGKSTFVTGIVKNQYKDRCVDKIYENVISLLKS